MEIPTEIKGYLEAGFKVTMPKRGTFNIACPSGVVYSQGNLTGPYCPICDIHSEMSMGMYLEKPGLEEPDHIHDTEDIYEAETARGLAAILTDMPFDARVSFIEEHLGELSKAS